MPTTTAAVTIRPKMAECITPKAACRLKNLLRLLAQWLMCEASAAVSVDTKSEFAKFAGAGEIEGVMVCSGNIVLRNLASTPYVGCTLAP